MKTSMRLAVVVIAVLFSACASGPAKTAGSGGGTGYRIETQWLSQPLDHKRPDGGSFDQEITILIPDEAPPESPVFFILGNEGDYTTDQLLRLYKVYGRPADVIFLQIEHRGYGQSLSPDEDQSMPRYVSIDQALADYHRAVGILKQRFTGHWMAAGYSYGGGLVIDYAHRYPDDVSVILASSAVIRWPFFMPEYDRQMRENLGENLYRAMARHIHHMKPETLFDKIWQQREFLVWLSLGLSQYARYQTLHPVVVALSHLPTPMFVGMLRWMDRLAAGGRGWSTAQSLAKQSLSRQEAMSGKFNWRYWKYQQCSETGTFWVSADADGLFPRSEEEILTECRAMFGEEPPAATALPWNPAAMTAQLTMPQVHVIGGKDPWKALCLPPDHGIAGVTYIYAANGFHCPDRDDPVLGKQVLEKMRELLAK